MTRSGSSSAVPLPVRRRLDLILAATGSAAQTRWTVKDPMTLQYFQLGPAEHFVFQQLDGTVTMEEIQRRFLNQYAPEQLSADQITAFLQRLWNQGLVVVERFGLTSALLARHDEQEARSRFGGLSSLLAIRFRGIDPDRFLTACLPVVGWIFSMPALLAGLLLMAAAVLLIAGDSDQLFRELSRPGNFLSADRLVWLMATIGVVKVLHELGHGIVFKRQGGECRELGLMLLVFTPCLYCNVSDAWLFRSRWQRAAVSGAGIYVELLLASVCGLLWWGSVSGTFHAVCLNVMLICSVNTLLLNGNPLLRYDGYYVLSDLLDIPNLRSRSQRIVRGLATRWFCGVSLPEPHPPRGITRLGMACYGLASSLYGWVLIVGILWMLYRVAERREVEALILVLAPVLLGSRLWQTITNGRQTVQAVRQSGLWRPVRFWTAVGVTSLGAGMILFWPFPRVVRAPAQIVAVDPQTVFVSAPGRAHCARPLTSGEQVTAGQELAVLSNPQLEREVIALRGEIARYQERLQHLTSRAIHDPGAADLQPGIQSALADYEQRLRTKERELRQLTLRAPCSGQLLPPESTGSRQHGDSPLQRQGIPFAAENNGAWLDVGEPFAVVADPEKRDAVLYIDQTDSPLVAPGDAVLIAVPQSGGWLHSGTVMDLAVQPLQHVPPVLAQSSAIPLVPASDGTVRPIRPVYEVRVRLADESSGLVPGQLGWGRIAVGNESLAMRWLRAVRRTLTFEL